MQKLALTIPGYGQIDTPENIPSGADSPGNVITFGLNMLVVLGVIAALIFIIYAGILWTTSGGDKAKLDKARRTIIFSIVGLIVMVLAFVIIQVVGTILGSNYLSNFGGNNNGSQSSIQTPSGCTANGGTCASGLSCAPDEDAIGLCNTNPVQACCR